MGFCIKGKSFYIKSMRPRQESEAVFISEIFFLELSREKITIGLRTVFFAHAL